MKRVSDYYKSYFLSIVLVFVFNSCSNVKNESSVNEEYTNLKKIEALRKSLLKDQRISTLKNLWYAYDKTNEKSIILADAFYMANTKNDPFACHLIFEGYLYLYFPEIKNIENINVGEYFFKLPLNERELIIHYLEKGAEQKFFKCVNDLIKIYEYENNPKAEYYKSIKDLKYIQDFY